MLQKVKVLRVPVLSDKFGCRWDGKKLFLECKTEKGAKLCCFPTTRYTPSQIFVMVHDFQVMSLNYPSNSSGSVLRPRKHQTLKLEKWGKKLIRAVFHYFLFFFRESVD